MKVHIVDDFETPCKSKGKAKEWQPGALNSDGQLTHALL